MYKFIKINRLDIITNPYWVLYIESDEDMQNYLNIRGPQIMRSYLGLKDPEIGKRHLTDDEWAIMKFFENIDPKIPRSTVFDDAVLLNDKFAGSYIKSFINRGPLIVNEVGGFCSLSAIKCDVLETQESQMFIFPHLKDKLKPEDIRVIQWINGSHYYCKIRDVDVVWNGEQKWNTEKEAKEAGNKYFKKYFSE